MFKKKQQDYILLLVVFILLLVGIIMISSVGAFYAEHRFEDQYFFLKRQFLSGLIPGLIIMLILGNIDYRKLRKFSVLFFLISLALLVMVFIGGIGRELYGAKRWIQFGFINFQPSEVFKLALVLYLASWLESKKHKMSDFFEGLVPFIIILSIGGFLIIKQPDMGTLGIILITSIAMYFISGSKLSHLGAFILFGLGTLFFLIKSAPYRFQRFLVFINPGFDPKGAGYQVTQALLAVGSGGIFGVGLGHSRQKFNYLPEPVGDSIFAIIGEEFGLLGCLVIITLFLILAFRGYKIAKNAPDDYGKMIAVGITSWIIFQALINIMAIIGLIPLTGVPLPFISYGGSSLVFLLAGIGILLNISKQSKIN